MPTNEEYFQRWEESAPTPVAGEPAIARRSTKTYDEELTPQQDEALELAMAEYAMNVSDAEGSSETKDELARLKQGSDEQAREYQWVTPEEYKNEGDRIGRIMHHVSFLNKLRSAGVKCWYRDHPQPGKITLIVQRKDLPAEVGCWCQAGFAPELSIMRFDEHGVPLAEKYRGWRTPLLQLILKGVIPQKKAEEVFGKVPVTPAFHRYNATLQQFRNNDSRLED